MCFKRVMNEDIFLDVLVLIVRIHNFCKIQTTALIKIILPATCLANILHVTYSLFT